MATKGGKRNGAGRPKGAKTLIKAIDYFNDKELKDFWNNLKERAKTDSKIALYFAEQFTGKAPQPIEGEVNANIILTFDNTFKDAPNTPR